MVMLNTQPRGDDARPPVLFIHGLWLKPSSWDGWRALFEDAGYITQAPGWPTEVSGSSQAETIGQVVAHYARIISGLPAKPILVGHSFGGLIVQILAGRGLAAATVALSPAPFRGVLPLPISALRSAWPVLKDPANAGRRVSLTPAEFRYAFGNAVSAEESDRLFSEYHAPAPGRPIFQAAAANLNPWTEAGVDTGNANRGPLLIVASERDHTVPPVLSEAAYRLQARNRYAATEIVKAPGRGHSLTVDSGWREVAAQALSFAERHL